MTPSDPDRDPQPDDACRTCGHPRAAHPVALPGGATCEFRVRPDGRPPHRAEIEAARALRQRVREGLAELDAGAGAPGQELFARRRAARRARGTWEGSLAPTAGAEVDAGVGADINAAEAHVRERRERLVAQMQAPSDAAFDLTPEALARAAAASVRGHAPLPLDPVVRQRGVVDVDLPTPPPGTAWRVERGAWAGGRFDGWHAVADRLGAGSHGVPDAPSVPQHLARWRAVPVPVGDVRGA